ncbi:MAG: glycosyltransferase family 2 protein [bacterium]|nr:glycosyltransferase family 2 protein [bacterium]
MNEPFISVILPAYNEGGRIQKTLAAIRDYFKDKPYTAEVIVVSDGSSDNTASVVTSFALEYPELRLIEYSPNRGKGYAVKTGMLAARGRFRLYMDADNAISITHMDSFFMEMNGVYDMVIGSIHLPGSRRAIEYEWYRRVLSFIGGILIRFCASSGTTDALRAFKLFTADAATSIFPKQTIDRFGFDMEVLALARKHGLRVKELPVAWLNPHGDRVTLRGYFSTLWELFVIRWNLFSGVYDKTARKKFRHWAAIFAGIAVGVVYVSHHFLIPGFLRAPDVAYYPITKQAHHDEATLYALRANAAYRGQWLSGDISLAEYAGSPAILSIVNPVIMGGLGRILGSLQSAFIVSDFLFPALIFFVLYFLFWELTNGRKIPSLLFASVFIFSPKIGLYIPPVSLLNVRELLFNFLPFLSEHSKLYFSEIEEPKVTFLFLIVCMYLIVRALQRRETATTVGAGISFGLLFYTYFYDFVSVGVALAILAFMCLWQRDFSSVKKLVLIGGVGTVTSLGYWLNFFLLHRLPQYQDIWSEVGLEIGRRFRFLSVWKSYVRNTVLVFCVAALPLFRRRPAVLFFVAMLLGYFVTVNIQVFTGFNVQPDHWYRTLFLPVFLVMSLSLVFLYDRYVPLSYKRMSRSAATLFLIFFFASYFVSEYRTSRIYAEDFTIPVSELQSYQWLNAHTPPGSVVGALAYDTNYALLLHTHNKVFLPVGLATVSPHIERWQRLFELSKLYALSPENFKRYASGGAYYLFGGKYLDHGFDRSFYHNALNYTFPDSFIQEKTVAYAQYSFDKTALYRLDYLYVGPREEALGGLFLQPPSSYKKVYDSGGIRIYQLPRELEI